MFPVRLSAVESTPAKDSLAGRCPATQLRSRLEQAGFLLCQGSGGQVGDPALQLADSGDRKGASKLAPYDKPNRATTDEHRWTPIRSRAAVTRGNPCLSVSSVVEVWRAIGAGAVAAPCRRHRHRRDPVGVDAEPRRTGGEHPKLGRFRPIAAAGARKPPVRTRFECSKWCRTNVEARFERSNRCRTDAGARFGRSKWCRTDFGTRFERSNRCRTDVGA
jgi:hypothetical protein